MPPNHAIHISNDNGHKDIVENMMNRKNCVFLLDNINIHNEKKSTQFTIISINIRKRRATLLILQYTVIHTNLKMTTKENSL